VKSLVQNESSSGKVEAISRRAFTRNILSTAAVGVIPLASVGAETIPEKASAQKPEDLTLEDWDEVQARYKNLIRVYGQRLSAFEKS
jgi:hypothetical protein